MEKYGPRTDALASFDNDMNQSFLLAKLVSKAALSALDEVTKEVTNGNIDTKNQMAYQNDLEKLKAMKEELGKVEKLKNDAEELLKLGQETTPNILFILLMTKFEAYLDDITALMCHINPPLVGLKVGASEEDIRKKINDLFFGQRLDQIADIFWKQFRIPFAEICKRAKNCTPRELDKAKAIRNIHIHNRGMINPKFKNRIGDQSLKVGQYYLLSMEYINDLKDKISLLVLGLDIWATTQYPDIPRTNGDISMLEGVCDN